MTENSNKCADSTQYRHTYALTKAKNVILYSMIYHHEIVQFVKSSLMMSFASVLIISVQCIDGCIFKE